MLVLIQQVAREVADVRREIDVFQTVPEHRSVRVAEKRTALVKLMKEARAMLAVSKAMVPQAVAFPRAAVVQEQAVMHHRDRTSASARR